MSDARARLVEMRDKCKKAWDDTPESEREFCTAMHSWWMSIEALRRHDNSRRKNGDQDDK